jgi:hypothetical protein
MVTLRATLMATLMATCVRYSVLWAERVCRAVHTAPAGRTLEARDRDHYSFSSNRNCQFTSLGPVLLAVVRSLALVLTKVLMASACVVLV